MKWWMFILLLAVPGLFFVLRMKKRIRDWRGYVSLGFVGFLICLLFWPMVKIPTDFYGTIFVLFLFGLVVWAGNKRLKGEKMR